MCSLLSVRQNGLESGAKERKTICGTERTKKGGARQPSRVETRPAEKRKTAMRQPSRQKTQHGP
ncbi:hypothetical protein PF003_g22044 [Phytophthora fragariae]|nr:hypothetical protein PF003_g22044 [Phytophthora fragariae]